MPKIVISRTSGPSTDVEVDSDFLEKDIPIIKDVLAMVNRASGNKEKWYLIIDDGEQIIPYC